MKVLITGCAGFAGSHLAEYLLAKGEEVVALLGNHEDLKNLQHIENHLQIARGDVRDSDRLLELLLATRPRRIYHLAAFSSPLKSLEDPQTTYQVNVAGTLNLLSAWLRIGMECRFLMVSSSDVYGPLAREKLPAREEMELAPVTPYGGSKAAAEVLALQFFRSYGLPVIRVRPFNHTGPRQSANFVCSKFAREVAEIELGLRQPVVYSGNLSVLRDFSDVRDIVRGYHDLMEGGAPGEVYQLCSGNPVSIESILRTVISFAAQPVQVSIDESLVRNQESAELWGDYSKARLAVGWEPRYQLADTLRTLKIYWETRVESSRRGQE